MSTLAIEPGVFWIESEQRWEVTPFSMGPVWTPNPEWDGVDEGDHWILPELTLGWQILKWVEDSILGDEVDPITNERLAFTPTAEQARFILWWYAIDERGRFLYREGVFQRIKGHGKDPLLAVIALVELIGPCRFRGWATRDMPDIGVYENDPVARDNPVAWVQVAAVSEKQTKNTSLLFNSMLRKELHKKYGWDPGKVVSYAYSGARQIECVTSSPSSLEGNRPSFVIMNETHHWLENNDGHAMAEAIKRNATKSKGGQARRLAITNAYDPSENSVAQQRRESYEEQLAGLAYDSKVLYDTLEAPPDARIRPKKLHPGAPDPTDDEVKAYLGAIVSAVRGDSTWLDLETILDDIMDTDSKPGLSRRFYFNQVVASENAWVDPAAIQAAIDKIVADQRRIPGVDDIQVGWSIVMPEDPIVVFFDGSKSDDATGLVGCRISDGYCFTIGIWSPPAQKERAKKWLAPRGAVDQRVREMFERFNILGFWADPSHATDDEDGSRYWDDMIDDWMKRYKDKLEEKTWPVKGGLLAHAVMFDMTSPTNQKAFVGMAETTVEDFETLDRLEEFAPIFKIDGHPALVQHLRNARSNPSNKWGVSLMKTNRESKHKIDLAVCLVGARLLRRVYLNTVPEEDTRSGRVW
jgi:hypothetical protein